MATTFERNNPQLKSSDQIVERSDTTWVGYVLIILAILAIGYAAWAFMYSSNTDDMNARVGYTTGANEYAPVYEPASGPVNDTLAQDQFIPNQNANTVNNYPANDQFIVPNDPYLSANTDPAFQNQVPQSGQ
jgi:hypothetical protein